MNISEAKAAFALSGIQVEVITPLEKGYWLVTTKFGNVQIGGEKGNVLLEWKDCLKTEPDHVLINTVTGKLFNPNLLIKHALGTDYSQIHQWTTGCRPATYGKAADYLAGLFFNLPKYKPLPIREFTS